MKTFSRIARNQSIPGFSDNDAERMNVNSMTTNKSKDEHDRFDLVAVTLVQHAGHLLTWRDALALSSVRRSLREAVLGEIYAQSSLPRGAWRRAWPLSALVLLGTRQIGLRVLGTPFASDRGLGAVRPARQLGRLPMPPPASEGALRWAWAACALPSNGVGSLRSAASWLLLGVRAPALAAWLSLAPPPSGDVLFVQTRAGRQFVACHGSTVAFVDAARAPAGAAERRLRVVARAALLLSPMLALALALLSNDGRAWCAAPARWAVLALPASFASPLLLLAGLSESSCWHGTGALGPLFALPLVVLGPLAAARMFVHAMLVGSAYRAVDRRPLAPRWSALLLRAVWLVLGVGEVGALLLEQRVCGTPLSVWRAASLALAWLACVDDQVSQRREFVALASNWLVGSRWTDLSVASVPINPLVPFSCPARVKRVTVARSVIRLLLFGTCSAQLVLLGSVCWRKFFV